MFNILYGKQLNVSYIRNLCLQRRTLHLAFAALQLLCELWIRARSIAKFELLSWPFMMNTHKYLLTLASALAKTCVLHSRNTVCDYIGPSCKDILSRGRLKELSSDSAFMGLSPCSCFMILMTTSHPLISDRGQRDTRLPVGCNYRSQVPR